MVLGAIPNRYYSKIYFSGISFYTDNRI